MTDLETFTDQPGREELSLRCASRSTPRASRTCTTSSSPSPVGSWVRASRPSTGRPSRGAGFQLVYGSTANLFVDRDGNYIGYGPEARELVGLPDVETFCVLPWDRKTARVFCTLFRGREEEVDGGAFLTSDCRGNLKRIHDAFTAETGLHLRAGHRARDDVAEDQPRRYADGGGQDQAVLLPHRPVLGAAAHHPQGDGVRRGDGPGHDPRRPRGRARPARAELQVRPVPSSPRTG